MHQRPLIDSIYPATTPAKSDDGAEAASGHVVARIYQQCGPNVGRLEEDVMLPASEWCSRLKSLMIAVTTTSTKKGAGCVRP